MKTTLAYILPRIGRVAKPWTFSATLPRTPYSARIYRSVWGVFLLIVQLTLTAKVNTTVNTSLVSSDGTIQLRFAADETSSTYRVYLQMGDVTVARQDQPAQLTMVDAAGKLENHCAAYNRIEKMTTGSLAYAEISPASGVCFKFVDCWSITDSHINLDRAVHVSGNAREKFLTAFSWQINSATWSATKFFVPAALFGGTPAPETPLEVREDAMTAPILGLFLPGEYSIAIIDRKLRPNPSPKEYSASMIWETGGMGAREIETGGIEAVYWYPGSHGLFSSTQYNYAPAAVPNGGGRSSSQAKSPLPAHPVKDGFTHSYSLAFKVAGADRFHDFYRAAWRLCWQLLDPPVYHHDLEVVRKFLVNLLISETQTINGRTGLQNFVDFPFQELERTSESLTTEQIHLKRNYGAIMGFTGKNIEAAVLMLMEAERSGNEKGKRQRRLALAIIETFLKNLKLNPPTGEGFDLETGETMQAIPLNRGFPPQVYLRSYSDDLKLLLLGYKFEKQHGRLNPEWLSWCKGFGDWLLTQQYDEGGYPRSWVPGTGEVRVSDPQSSYNPIPFLVLLSELTGEKKYLDSAVRAGEFVWSKWHIHDKFIGGTIDNPNVQDKEAATLSLEAYLSLYEGTSETEWLRRAEAAATNAETYIYIWERQRGACTVGPNKVTATLQGGSGDMYMAYDVDDYAKLYRYTGDRHYFDVAKLLLHNTKMVMAIPGRLYDLPGPGWQTEPANWPGWGRKGWGIWLPWVSTSQLHGIVLTQWLEPELFEELSRFIGQSVQLVRQHDVGSH